MKAATRSWTLEQLASANRNAVVVYTALRCMSGDKRQLNTTRAKIKALTGMHKDTITKAMKILSDSGWATVNYGRAKNRVWYRLSFPQKAFFPKAGETGPRDLFPKTGRSGPREPQANGQNRSEGDVPLNRSDRSIPVGVGAAPATALPSDEGGAGTTPGKKEVANFCGDPIARREHEMLSEIEARSNGTQKTTDAITTVDKDAGDGKPPQAEKNKANENGKMAESAQS